MTEERKKYMGSISKKELAIRLKIVISKSRIKLLKQFMVVDKYDDELIREEKQTIAQEKIFIKALKKQLPAPTIEVKHEHLYSYQCPICKAEIVYFPCYCSDCGKKLRRCYGTQTTQADF